MAEGFSDGEAAPADIEGASLGVKTFLIADVRGYTRFTQEHGDEAAARLAAAFAETTRAGVAGRGGEVIELRGDEALAVFNSARQALRAALELQTRYSEASGQEPGLPLAVGIGLDAGEAVPLERGYRGAALNLAARLCSNAEPGEVLASEGVVRLAGKVEGLEYRAGGRLRLKGLAEPVRAYQVVTEGAAPLKRKRPRTARAPAAARGRLTGVAIAGVLIAAVAVALVLLLGGSSPALAHIDANAAGAINIGSNKMVDQVLVGSGPGRVAAGAGSLWVANVLDNTVSRVDPRAASVEQTIRVDSDPTALAVGGGAVWVASSGTRRLLRINPETNTVVQHIRVGNGPSGVAVSPAAVWVTNRLDDTVTEIDSTSGRVKRTLDAGSSPSDVSYGLGALWIANESSSTVTRLDPRTGGLQGVAVGNGPEAVAAGGGSVWVANSLDGTVSRIDPARNVVTATIPVGLGPSSVLVSPDGVWVADSYGNRVSRIDPATNRVVAAVDVGNGPQSLALLDGRVWLSVRGAAAVHRGGTLRVLGGVNVDSLDSGVAYAPGAWSILADIGDGLVGFKRVSGLDGGTPVPDLATSLPVPVDGGRTYTFQLRRGIRYSNGQPVLASDFRRALERVFRLGSDGSVFYQGVLGAASCSKSSCDLSRGVVAVDQAGPVTFHLRAPDPEFFYKLALPFAYPVPSSVSATKLERLGVPGTGPYEIGSYDNSSQQAVLVRNPHFQQWSAAAQPDGFPDRIVWRHGGTPDERLTAVERGLADFMGPPPFARHDEIATRYTAQVHVFPRPGTYGFFLNTRVPPFNSLAARRALNFAVDRRELSIAFGGAEGAVVTCQLLPPGSPGYRPYCPYTLNPKDKGTWSAPDLAEARKLVAASGSGARRSSSGRSRTSTRFPLGAASWQRSTGWATALR